MYHGRSSVYIDWILQIRIRQALTGVNELTSMEELIGNLKLLF